MAISIRPVPPVPSSDVIRRRMQTTKRRDTKPELLLRSCLHQAGLRYFVDRKPLDGMRRRADIVFPRLRIAVYVNGCFWHACPQHGTLPKNNGQFWADKLEKNRQRDDDTHERLREAGWIPIVVWEHEDPGTASARVFQAVDARKKLH